MNKSRIWLSPPHMGGQEIQLVKEAFESNWISPAGPHIQAFEEELGAYLGSVHCAALSSGTAAIHLALIVLGVKPGDEVICSSFTFAGSCNPIMYVGATPVFVDSEELTWNLDPELLEEAIKGRLQKTGKKPKAIIVVHLYGMPAQMDKIMPIARHYEIPVIEDAAEALGASLLNVKVGTWGDIGIFSFNGNKIITTSGGGALVSRNSDYVEQARFLATQAREKTRHYEHKKLGYNYRLSNVCAAIGRGQLKYLDQFISRRREIFGWYKELLQHKGFCFLQEPPGFFANRWLTTPLLSQDGETEQKLIQIIKKLETENIESRPLWKPMHLQPLYENFPAIINGVSERVFRSGLCLPSGSALKPEEVKYISDIILKIV
ncbi:MAG: DegT/DnrJ/EryC1/StrS family aminotransferase [Cyclobacteriaceae bacterium]|nr:DegT/DnrJ/EryC1/StrS family aminotransferase [Cyclobacteriaceae bacterium]